MRKIITTTFITLDGVMQAPGGPEEDTSGGFAYGGWSFSHWDKLMGDTMGAIMNQPFELLLGSVTYDIFAAYWPTAKSDLLVAEKFNATTKHVISHNPQKEIPWQNSVLITGDVVTKLKELKQSDGPDLWVHGSGKLIQTLLANYLIDRMIIWTFPVTLGSGKRLFAEGTQAEGFQLIDSKTASTGVVIATFEPQGPGSLTTGTLPQ